MPRRVPVRATAGLVCLAAALAGPPAAAAPSAADGDDALTYAQAVELARRQAPVLQAQQAVLSGSRSAAPAASTLPDPRLSLGLENLPIAGADRWSTTRDTATMQRLSLMQEVPNRAKREARALGAQARVERDHAMLAVIDATVRRDAGLAWLAVRFAEMRQAALADLARENRLLQDTLAGRIAAGTAQPVDLTMARQEALSLADRADDLARDVRRARAELGRWVGARADAPLAGDAPAVAVDAATLRAALPHHVELRPYAPMRAMAQAEIAEADAERRGDWSWEVAYGRRPRYDDMVSFQVTVDLPWQRGRRQQPLADARRRDAERIDAERDEALRRHGAEMETLLADLQALDAQAERLRRQGQPLAAERVALAMAAYQGGRGDLAAVLAARAQVLEARLRALDLDAQRAALRVRLSTLIAE